MIQNAHLAENALEESALLVREMQTKIQGCCQDLESYKESTTKSFKQFSEKLEADKSQVLASVQEMDKIVQDASVKHKETMGQVNGKSETKTAEFSRIFERQGSDSSDWNNKITLDLHTTKHQIDKFLEEDLRRDVPTGLSLLNCFYLVCFE